MKIKIDERSLLALEEIKKNTDELLEMNLNEMEVTDENIKKAKEISDRLYKLTNSVFRIGGLNVFLETEDDVRLEISLLPVNIKKF